MNIIISFNELPEMMQKSILLKTQKTIKQDEFLRMIDGVLDVQSRVIHAANCCEDVS